MKLLYLDISSPLCISLCSSRGETQTSLSDIAGKGALTSNALFQPDLFSTNTISTMSQEEPSDSQQSGTDAPWPGNITNCLSETQSLFTDQQESDEIGSIYADVETALTAGNEARRRELDVTRDRLRGMLYSLPVLGSRTVHCTELLATPDQQQQLYRDKPNHTGYLPSGHRMHLPPTSTSRSSSS